MLPVKGGHGHPLVGTSLLQRCHDANKVHLKVTEIWRFFVTPLNLIVRAGGTPSALEGDGAGEGGHYLSFSVKEAERWNPGWRGLGAEARGQQGFGSSPRAEWVRRVAEQDCGAPPLAPPLSVVNWPSCTGSAFLSYHVPGKRDFYRESSIFPGRLL